ncbi:uncharacterized protein SAPINGB_P000745 [Magnusiomyces paraingens]|uniref:Major facilitator superfamily (MFS) profile domain-containing protein n=1 Tax=Magnusiomyces paraingens TaxID=2606893 RepID=A0A5E8B1Y1_9ASCO|nr:uncharacterized protein SAPINGB_P000745 [Saprochaete ingens]VVT45423.1 unnamed protein product [Saprochaete ingens]
MAGPSYLTLPHRDQILVLVICRLIEPLAYTSISPYLYYLVEWFGYKSPATITALGTIVVSGFALGQAATGMYWGSLSDRIGRKPVIMFGLIGTAVATLIFGFATDVYVATGARLLAGTLNGNVGVMRTMIAELCVGHKEYQSRAFTVMPITFNIGTILGPVVGGMLADPATAYPNSWIGKVALFKKFPYLLPNIFPMPLLAVAMVICMLFLKETQTGPDVWWPPEYDPGLRLGNWLRGKSTSYSSYTMVSSTEEDEDSLLEEEEEEIADAYVSNNNTTETSTMSIVEPTNHSEPEFGLRDILTRPVAVTITCYTLLMFHCPAFLQMLPLYMATPRVISNTSLNEHLPLVFDGGLGMPESRIGAAIALMGMTGIILQFAAYPRIAAAIGNARAHRVSLYIFPIAYVLAPFTTLLTRKGYSGSTQDSRWTTVAAIVPIAMAAILGRTLAIPPMPVLLTNAATESHRERAMGKIHGLAASVTSVAKCMGPFVLGNLYSWGVHIGIVGLAWWIMAGVVIAEIFVASGLREWGEEEEEDDHES